LNATKNLKQEHILIRRIRDISQRCSKRLYCHEDIPFEHLKIISLVIEEFIDTLHHRKEGLVYFPAAVGKNDDRFSEDIYKFMVEHEFSRRIATMLSGQLASWKNSTSSKEPIARFLKTYALFITDHTKKKMISLI
jgi:hemerythrin-like domain-containing protein